MSSECWLRKQKFVENSNYLRCIWTFIPVPSNTAGPIWNIWSSHAREKKSYPYIKHVRMPQFKTIFNRCTTQWHLTSDDVEISCTGIVLWQQLLYCSVIYEKIIQVQDQLEYIYINKFIIIIHLLKNSHYEPETKSVTRHGIFGNRCHRSEWNLG